MRKIVSLLTVLMLFCALAYAQTRTVTGVVRDERGTPVPFATITETGTKKATTADVNGKYSITIGPNSSLTITSSGFQNLTVKPSGMNQDVSLKSNDTQLQEVVVTGAYNTKRTARSTSFNAQVVTSEQLNVIRQPNLNNALAGKVSGLQVRGQSAAALGRTGDVRLRGESGLGGGEGIIYVVDGTILPNADDVNIDDVENITVLQGPSAAAQFGPQGANGAIVITLKKARKSAQGIGVDLNIGAQFDKVYILPQYQNSYAGGAYGDLQKYTWQPGQPEEWKALDGKYYPDYSDDASWGPRMVGQEYIPWYAWYGGHSRSYQTAALTPQPDNARDFYNTGVVLNNSVSFSKATDAMNLRFSYGNVDVKGLTPTTWLKKNTLNLNTSIDLNKHFTVGANINYINQKVNGDINDAYSNQSTGSFNQWFHRDLDMDILRELKDLKTPQGIYASWNHLNPTSYNASNPRSFYAGNYWYNFFTWLDLAQSLNQRDRLYGDLSLTYNITKDLKLRGTYR
ncbi:MAG: carboxypeptidase-like regulatory domain-containing protein, partial [Flavisolibacter sp.]